MTQLNFEVSPIIPGTIVFEMEICIILKVDFCSRITSDVFLHGAFAVDCERNVFCGVVGVQQKCRPTGRHERKLLKLTDQKSAITILAGNMQIKVCRCRSIAETKTVCDRTNV